MVFVFILISLKEQELKTTYRIFDIFFIRMLYIFSLVHNFKSLSTHAQILD